MFTSLYDFYKLKGNVYTYHGDLVSLVNDLYRGLKLQRLVRRMLSFGPGRKPKFKSFINYYYLSRKFIPRLRLFALGLDMTFSFATVQQMRSAFAELCKDASSVQFP